MSVSGQAAALGRAFMESGELSVGDFLANERPRHAEAFGALPGADARLAFETLVTWQATLLYRLQRVERLLPFTPMLVGDPGWHELLPRGG